MYSKDLLGLTKHQIQQEAEEIQKAYVAGDDETRKTVDDLEQVRDGSPTERQALRVVSRRYGFHNWTKFRSYVELDPRVQEVIHCVRFGDLDRLKKTLQEYPAAANPIWPERDDSPKPIPNDSIPLFMVCIGLAEKTNTQNNAYNLVKSLLDAGANPDIEDSIPLGGAASFNQLDIAEALLDGGAKIDGENGDGWPLALALFFGWDVAKLLEKRGAKMDLRLAAGLGRVDVMASFFQTDGTLNAEAGVLRMFWGKVPESSDADILSQALVSACITNQVEAVEFLLEKGADINAMPKGFDFPATGLQRAIRRSNVDVAKMLIEHGADLTLKDGRHGDDALGWAERIQLDEIAELIRQKQGVV